jgi:hypothetical protein
MVDFYRKFTKQSKDEKFFRTAAQQNLITAEDAESAENNCCIGLGVLIALLATRAI